MKQVEIRRKVRRGDYLYTLHAEIERKADDLTFGQIEKALLAVKSWNSIRIAVAERVA